MDEKDFARKIEVVQQRVDELLRHAAGGPAQLNEALPEVFEELQNALEEVQVAAEELRQQHEELVAARQAMEAERQRYQELFEFASDGYLVTDADGTIQEANRAAATLLQMRKDILTNKPLSIFVAEEDRTVFWTQLAEIIKSQRVQNWEVRLQPRGGFPFLAAVTVAIVQNAENKGVSLRWLLHDITEPERVEQALRESEERYRQFFEENLSGTYISKPDGKLIACNDSFARIFCFNSVEEAMRCNLVSLYPNPQAREIFLELLRKNKKLERYETEFRCHHGKPIHVIENAIGTVDERGELIEIKGFLIDNTERKKAEQALRESEERFRSLIQTAGSVIICLSPHRRILEWNLEAERVYGWKREEVLGKDYFELFLPEAIRDAVAADMKKVLAGEPTRYFENSVLKRDGSERLLLWNITRLLDDKGHPIGVIAIGQDITETKALRQTAQRMQRLAALGEFAATIVHEIRNPLASIILNYDNLSEQLGDSNIYRKTFRNIEQGVARIQSVINGILDFARPTPPALKKTNLHKVLDSSLRTIAHDLEQAGIVVKKNYAAIQPDILIDADQMMQVFINLFLNAKDAMSSGGKLTIGTTSCENSIEVQIADTGKGIPPENVEKIFVPFFTTKAEGVGLGLAVVSRILEQHHAHISVESKIGIGTKFVIRFSAS